jgi:hypothetical protein
MAIGMTKCVIGRRDIANGGWHFGQRCDCCDSWGEPEVGSGLFKCGYYKCFSLADLKGVEQRQSVEKFSGLHPPN